MATTPRQPRAYRPGVIARVLDGLRYGGGLGQWTWLLHRLTGLGILFFLLVHVLDTFFVVVVPAWYDHTVAIYGGIWFDGNYYVALRWLFRVAELGLIASVVFHAVNGLGVILYDFWRKGSLYRKEILRVVQIVFWIIMIPTTVKVLEPLTHAPDRVRDVQEDIRSKKAAVHAVEIKAASPSAAPAPVAKATTPGRTPRSTAFMIGAAGVAAIWFATLSLVPPTGARVRPATGYELRAWYLMRISGLLLVFLAVGHLFIMHIVNNVETINYAFVASRWAAPRTGFIWRLWDFSMIVLALGHGFNGLRQVLYEYIARPGRRVLASTLIWLSAVALTGIGSYAIFMFVPDQAYIAEHPVKVLEPTTAPPSDPPLADRPAGPSRATPNPAP